MRVAVRHLRLPRPGARHLRTSRPLLLVLALTAFAAPPAAAVVVPPGYVSAPVTIGGTPAGAQVDPSVAARPGGGGDRVLALTDYGAGGSCSTLTPHSSFSHFTGASWTTPAPLCLPGGVRTTGHPAAAWAPDDGAGAVAYVASEAVGTSACSADSGIWLSSSSTGGSFLAANADQVGSDSSSPSPVQYRRPAIAIDLASKQPLLVAEANEFAPGQCGVPGAVTQTTLEVFARSRPTDSFVPLTLTPSTGTIADASRPAIAVSADGITVAWLHALPAGLGEIDTLHCETAFLPFWSCGQVDVVASGFTAATSVAGAPISSAPAIAADSSGRIHVAWTEMSAAGDADVLYAVSDTSGHVFGAPATVADPTAARANQFMPAISVAANGRADVVYLDTRSGSTTYAPYETSFRSPDKGMDKALSAALSPLSAEFGDSLAAVTLGDVPDAYAGRGFGYWPSNGNVYEGAVWHGAATPTLPAGDRSGPKNQPIDLAPLLTASDPDGDPVATSVAGPPTHGTIVGSVYVPQQSYAGPDPITISASDGFNPVQTAAHTISTYDAAPTFAPPTFALAQGTTQILDLSRFVADADPGDGHHFALGPNGPAALAGRLTLDDAGHLRVALPPDLRSAAPLRVPIVISDDTVPTPGQSSGAFVGLSIAPVYRLPVVGVTQTVSGMVVQFTPTLLATDEPPLRSTYTWDFGDGSPPVTAPQPTHKYLAPGVYSYSVTVQITQDQGTTEQTLTGPVTIIPDGRTRLSIRSTLRRGRSLILAIASRDTARLTVSLRVRNRFLRPRLTRAVVGGANQSFGRRVRFAFSIRGLRARLADVVITYSAGLAGADKGPSPVVRRVWLR